MPEENTIFENASRDWSQSVRSRITPENFFYKKSIGSTNDFLMALAKEKETPPFALAVAEHQTSGRGRRGDAWVAPEGRNLLFSILLDLDLPPKTWTRLPHLVACSLGKAVESLLGDNRKVETKWPNDIYLEGKKLAGILVETSLTPKLRAIVGVGINVNMRPEEFPEELQETATSLYGEMGCESSRWYLLSLFLENLIQGFPNALEDFDECLSWLSERDFLKGKDVVVTAKKESVEGVASGIDEDGSLLVASATLGEIKIISCDQLLYC